MCYIPLMVNSEIIQPQNVLPIVDSVTIAKMIAQEAYLKKNLDSRSTIRELEFGNTIFSRLIRDIKNKNDKSNEFLFLGINTAVDPFFHLPKSFDEYSMRSVPIVISKHYLNEIFNRYLNKGKLIDINKLFETQPHLLLFANKVKTSNKITEQECEKFNEGLAIGLETIDFFSKHSIQF
jgi:hypothetical protein